MGDKICTPPLSPDHPFSPLGGGATALTTGQNPTSTPSRKRHLPSSLFLFFGRWVGGAVAKHSPWGEAHLFPVREGAWVEGADTIRSPGPGHREAGWQRHLKNFPSSAREFSQTRRPTRGLAVAKGAGAGAAERLGLVPTARGGGLSGAAGVAMAGPPG